MNNSGGMYDFGFMLGSGLIGFSAVKGTSRR